MRAFFSKASAFFPIFKKVQGRSLPLFLLVASLTKDTYARKTYNLYSVFRKQLGFFKTWGNPLV